VLTPNSRELLLDSLRPDRGFTLDAAVGTSYSLDLDALLTAPLAFAQFDIDAGTVDVDPIALLATIKSYADKMVLFTDASHIAVPPKERQLMPLLESTVVPVHIPDGSFHPKVWVLRYKRGRERRHRVLVLSRNLTFDRSWDTILRLDENLEGDTPGNASELSAFLEYLTGHSESPIPRDLIRSLAGKSFDVPDGFDTLRFWPMLADGVDPMAGVEAEASLVISPFVAPGRLKTLAKLAPKRALVTRPDTLSELGGTALEPWQQVFILRGEAAESDDDDLVTLSGLHAKVHVFDDGTRRRVFTGSANASTASIQDNIELLVELETQSAQSRIVKLLEHSEREPTLRSLLVERRPAAAEPSTKTAEELEADRLEALARTLAAQPATARSVRGNDDRWTVDFVLPMDGVELAAGDRLRARLVTSAGGWLPLAADAARATGELHAGEMSRLTRLIALELAGNPGLKVPARTFVIVAELLGAPAGREQQLLLDLIPNAEKLMRLLFMMLADGHEGPEAAAAVRRMLAGEAGDGDTGWQLELPLFENLVRTFSREPERLGGIRGVIEQLRSTDDGVERFPDGFLELWSTFEAALPKRRSR